MGYGHRTEGVHLTSSEVEWILSHAGRVDKNSFKATVIVLTCIALLISLGRLFYNKHHNTRFSLDDGLLFVATLCLIIETGCIYSYQKSLYLIDAKAFHILFSRWVQQEDDMRSTLEALKQGRIVVNSIFAWASIFVVKISCVAFFARVSGNTSKSLRIAVRGTLGATGLSGVLIFLLLFLQCPHFDRDAMKCVTRESWGPSLSLTVVEQVFNITTTLMIAGLFFLHFRQLDVRLDRKATIMIVTILSLCSCCIALGIARAAGGIYKNVIGVKQISAVWNCLLLHCEAATTILAGSVATLYRQSQTRASLYTADGSDLSMSFTSRIKSAGALILPKRTPTKQATDTQDMIGEDQNSTWPAPLSQDLGTPRLSVDDPRSSMQGTRVVPSADIADERVDQIRVTVECTITSEEATLSDLENAREDAITREWELDDEPEGADMNIISPPGGLNVNTMEGLDPALLGMITSGIRG